MRDSLIIFLILSFATSFAQSGESLAIEEYYKLVKEYHPIAKQIELIASRGVMELRAARGAFDPKLSSTYSAKNFDSKQYYEIWDTYLSLPTRLPLDFKIGYEQNNGVFLNPENNTDNAGLYYAGISVPLGQGLLANMQNIDLKKGKISNLNFQNQASIVLNNLLIDANQTYWLWYESFEKRRLINENIQLIRERYQGIKQAAETGELAAIDSVEALIQVQEWKNTLQKAEYELVTGKLLLQNFIWTDSLLAEVYIPRIDLLIELSDISVYENNAMGHPELQTIRLENDVLNLDKRIANDQLKPTVDFNYNFLLTEQRQLSEHTVFDNNYKVGLEFEMPLFLRKERAKLKTADLKTQENLLKISYKRREVINKVRQYYSKCLALQEMIAQQEQTVRNYITLAEAERIKFRNGESSIFLVNSRENKKIVAQMKLIELQSEFGVSFGRLLWSSGMLIQ